MPDVIVKVLDDTPAPRNLGAPGSELLSNVRLFFSKIGDDIPRSANPNDPFGFDPDSPNPIFTSSVTALRRAFVRPLEYTVSSLYPILGKTTDNFSIFETNENPSVPGLDFSSPRWIDFYRVIEFMYNNQATILSQGPDALTYIDSWLLSDKVPGQPDVDNIYRVNFYQPGSMRLGLSQHSGRIPSFTFNFEYLQNISSSFTVAFDPDIYIRQFQSLIRFVFTRYDAQDGVPVEEDTVTNDELLNDILDPVTQTITANWLITDSDPGGRQTFEVPDFGLNPPWEVSTMRLFIIYSNRRGILSTQEKQALIRTFLLQYWNNDVQFLARRYPTLFGTEFTNIYPIYDNVRIMPGNITRVVQPVTSETISRTLERYGFSSDYNSNGYRQNEIFYVGSSALDGDQFLPNETIIPCLAVSATALLDKSRFPITLQLPDYTSTYFGNTVQTATISIPALIFQFIIKKILEFNFNIITDESELLAFGAPYGMTRVTESTISSYFRFNYLSVEWRVYNR